MDMKYEFEVGNNRSIFGKLCESDSHLVTLREMFLVLNFHKVISLFTLLCELCQCNHTYVCALKVFDSAARVRARIFTPLDSL